MRLVKSISAKVGAATLAAGAWTTVVFAQGANQGAATGVNVGGSVGALTPVSGFSIKAILNNLINVGLGIVGILAVIYLVYGGLLYITAGGDAEKAGKGRTAITNAIIGIVIVLAALIIYNGVIGTFGSDTLA